MYFAPTSASWLNMLERFFRDITDKRLRCDRAGFESDPNVPQHAGRPLATLLQDDDRRHEG
jgi:hypothetical protein